VSGVRWEYRPGGSGFGHMQRVGDAGEYAAHTRKQEAYRAYLGHKTTCLDCGETACTAAEGLWQAYTRAKSGDSG